MLVAGNVVSGNANGFYLIHLTSFSGCKYSDLIGYFTKCLPSSSLRVGCTVTKIDYNTGNSTTNHVQDQPGGASTECSLDLKQNCQPGSKRMKKITVHLEAGEVIEGVDFVIVTVSLGVLKVLLVARFCS